MEREGRQTKLLVGLFCMGLGFYIVWTAIDPFLQGMGVAMSMVGLFSLALSQRKDK